MKKKEFRLGSSLHIEGIEEIVKEAENEVKITYDENWKPFTLEQYFGTYQIVVQFSEEEFKKLQKKALSEDKKLPIFVHDFILKQVME